MRADEDLSREELYKLNIDKGIELNKQLLTFYVVDQGRVRRSFEEPEFPTWKASTLAFYVEVQSIKAVSSAYLSRLYVEDGIILVIETYKENDKAPEGKKVWPSEVIWQSWRLAAVAEGGSPSDLRRIVVDTIKNDFTQAVISQAENLSTGQWCGNLCRLYTPKYDGFYAILGSQNGKGIVRLLLDHKKEIGYWTISSVFVLKSELETGSPSLLFELSEPRQLIEHESQDEENRRPLQGV
jgi:hypothetical protein